MQKIGFIGLGIMGRPMALNLLRKGVPLMVNGIVEEAVAVLTEAGAEYGDYASIAAQCPIIFTILPNGPIVDMALFSETGLATHLKPGQIVSDLSSVSPYEARSFGERLERIGVHFVDCPVSGGEPKAMDGTLSFMAGGSADVFEKLKPYYLKMGASAILTGPVGSGCVTKLANQIIVNMNIASLSEALVLAQKAGAAPDVFLQQAVDSLQLLGLLTVLHIVKQLVIAVDDDDETGRAALVVLVERFFIKRIIDEIHKAGPAAALG